MPADYARSEGQRGVYHGGLKWLYLVMPLSEAFCKIPWKYGGRQVRSMSFYAQFDECWIRSQEQATIGHGIRPSTGMANIDAIFPFPLVVC